jgi:hypothetical protein
VSLGWARALTHVVVVELRELLEDGVVGDVVLLAEALEAELHHLGVALVQVGPLQPPLLVKRRPLKGLTVLVNEPVDMVLDVA